MCLHFGVYRVVLITLSGLAVLNLPPEKIPVGSVWFQVALLGFYSTMTENML
jgi:hypothetical protein